MKGLRKPDLVATTQSVDRRPTHNPTARLKKIRKYYNSSDINHRVT